MRNKKSMLIWVSADIHKDIKRIAVLSDKTMTTVVESALKQLIWEYKVLEAKSLKNT